MLKGFRKVTLNPAESATISFPVTSSMLEYYIPGRGMVLEPGTFRIYIGPHAQTDNCKEFLIKGGC